MPQVRESPYERSHFLVDLGAGAEPIAVRRVELPAATADVVDHRSGDERQVGPDRRSERPDDRRLVIVRDVRGTTELYEWWSATRRGDTDVGRTVVITLLNELREPVWSWRFSRAVPVVYRFSALDATSSDPVEEIVELAFDAMTIE
jgi:phage tail-like protein